MVRSNMYLHEEILAEKESGRGALGTRALILKGDYLIMLLLIPFLLG